MMGKSLKHRKQQKVFTAKKNIYGLCLRNPQLLNKPYCLTFNFGRLCVSPVSPLNIMKSVAINLDADRAEKLMKLSETTSGYNVEVEVAGQTIEVQQRKVAPTTLALALLNSAIDNAFDNLPK